MKILVLNSGSSSVKFQIIETDLERMNAHQDLTLAVGLVEKIGLSDSRLVLEVPERKKYQDYREILEHRTAIGHQARGGRTPRGVQRKRRTRNVRVVPGAARRYEPNAARRILMSSPTASRGAGPSTCRHTWPFSSVSRRCPSGSRRSSATRPVMASIRPMPAVSRTICSAATAGTSCSPARKRNGR